MSQGGTVVLFTPHTTWQRKICCGTWLLPCKILGKMQYIRWFLKLLYLKWAHVWGRRMGDSSYSYALYTASVCRLLVVKAAVGWRPPVLWRHSWCSHYTHNTIVGVIKNIVSRELFSLEWSFFNFHLCASNKKSLGYPRLAKKYCSYLEHFAWRK